MATNEQAFAAIEELQKDLNKYSPARMVGEQLKDIIASTPGAADLVLADLGAKGMGLTDCEKKIADFARAHKVGNAGCCPPWEADRIIREFYGIPKETAGPRLKTLPKAEAQEPKKETRRVSLADFL